MEAIKGRDLAGAQLTTSGAGAEGRGGTWTRTLASIEKEQVRCREGEVWQFVQLYVCLSEQTGPVCDTVFSSFYFMY